MKKTEYKNQTTEFLAIIQKRKFNLPMLAELAGMPLGTFKNKLYQTQPTYFFTAEELREIYVKILVRDAEVQLETKRAMKALDKTIYTSKK